MGAPAERESMFCPDARLTRDVPVGDVGKVRRGFWETTAAPRPRPAEEALALGSLLTRLDGQEVVQLVQQLQQGRLLLGLTELEGHRTSGQQGSMGEGPGCLLSSPQPPCQELGRKDSLTP